MHAGRATVLTLLFLSLTGCGFLNFGGGQPVPIATGPNPYLYNASQDVLEFLPLQTADPVTGRLIYDYGQAPGAAQAYRVVATVSGSRLDARSLNLDVRDRSGQSVREPRLALEDAIFTRARQLRIADLSQ
ncbi:DUF3576 domain-containing protein [Loktanella sp. SALINAS62]|nr:DUF3576 domain-containing protein [Loktanella sp. SALINAS62]